MGPFFLEEQMSDWQPTADLDTLRARAELLRQLRAFFAARACLEVETPYLSHAANPDPHIDSMAVPAPGGAPRYLHTSPEFAMKRLLAAGSGDIYQVCHVFREGEAGGRHNPEFSMLEWYRVGLDHWQLMAEVAELLAELLALPLAEPHYLSYQQAFLEHTGLDPLVATAADYRQVAAGLGLAGLEAEGEVAVLQDWLFSHAVQPRLGRGRLSFVHSYPAAQAALARLDPEDPRVCRRFEVYFRGLELGNGFHELSDALEQGQRFAAQNELRRAQGRPLLPVDGHLLAALAAGLPDCAGVAIGLDRVLQLRLGLASLGETLAFAYGRA